MDIQYFLKILGKRFWIILTTMIIAAIATYILVGQLPDKYKSNAILSTGIIENRGFKIEDTNVFMQEFVTKTKFSNLIEDMTNRSSIKYLTINLLDHDLNTQKNEPFRLLTSLEVPENKDLRIEEINSLSDNLNILKYNNNTSEEDYSEKFKLFNAVSKALEYDYESLMKNLEVKRMGETDYLNVEFTSENPALSYYTVKSFCEEIIKLFQSKQLNNESTTVGFYQDLAEKNKFQFDSLRKLADDYRYRRNVLDIEEQSKNVVGQIRDLETRRETYASEIDGLKKNIANLEFNIKRTAKTTSEGYYNTSILNEKLIKIKAEIEDLQNKYIDSGQNDKSIQKKIADLVKERDRLSRSVANRVNDDIDETISENRKLREQKLQAELDLQKAEQGLESINREINRKESNKNTLVSNDSELSSIEKALEIAQKEYFDAKEKLNKALIESSEPSNSSQLLVLEPAQFPEKPESKNRAVLSAFAGVASGVLATLTLFLLAFFDKSLNSPYRFSQMYKLPLVGYINRISKKNLDFKGIFDETIQNSAVDEFKESLRKIRYTVETSGARTLLVTSNKEQEGKTFFLLSLAYSLSLGNRKVLIIDTNFRNNSLTKLATLPESDAPFTRPTRLVTSKNNYTDTLPVQRGQLPQNIQILGNFGGNISPDEAMAGRDFVRILFEYQQEFDYILLEGAALNQYADTRELAVYADKVVGVFAAQSSKKSADYESINYLKSIGDKYLGSILNRVDKTD